MTTGEARCRCGATHGHAAFNRLPRVHTLGPEELRGIVVRWPEGRVVEVRACDACGSAISRLVDQSAS